MDTCLAVALFSKACTTKKPAHRQGLRPERVPSRFLQSCSLGPFLQPCQNIGAVLSPGEECCHTFVQNLGQGPKVIVVTCCIFSFRGFSDLLQDRSASTVEA